MLKIYIFKILIIIIILRDWEIFSFDVIMAFFYRFIDKEIYVE